MAITLLDQDRNGSQSGSPVLIRLHDPDARRMIEKLLPGGDGHDVSRVQKWFGPALTAEGYHVWPIRLNSQDVNDGHPLALVLDGHDGFEEEDFLVNVSSAVPTNQAGLSKS